MSEHPRGRIAGWVLIALAGLAVAVALSVAASNLSTQPIGLSAEPLRAGDRLAPSTVAQKPVAAKKHGRKVRPKPGTTTGAAPGATASTTTQSPSDDYGGERQEARSGHRDGDD